MGKRVLRWSAFWPCPLSAIVATQASAEPDAKTDTMTKSESMTKKPAMSDADKRAKAADCSKKADAKGLHGERAREVPRGLQAQVARTGRCRPTGRWWGLAIDEPCRQSGKP